jgi:geranylgeranyl pyrophosphate synthase
MKPSPADCPAASPLLRLLDQELQRLAKSLPGALWERALVGPARAFLERPGKRFRARLVEAGWTLADGAATGVPIELVLAVELIHAGALIVDDVQDCAVTRRGGPALHRMVGVPLALNTGGWLYFLPLSLVERAGFDAETSAAIQRRMQHAMLVCHEGQALDLALRVTELEQGEIAAVVAETTARKTAALTELAAAVGALAAGGSAARVQALAAFGHELGIGLQMLDDLGSLTSPARADKAAEDLCGARPTWPWSWAAQDLAAPAFAELVAHARAVVDGEDPAALARRLAERVSGAGAARARAQLRHAYARLRATCPTATSAAVDAVERDFQMLEASYVL